MFWIRDILWANFWGTNDPECCVLVTFGIHLDHRLRNRQLLNPDDDDNVLLF